MDAFLLLGFNQVSWACESTSPLFLVLFPQYLRAGAGCLAYDQAACTMIEGTLVLISEAQPIVACDYLLCLWDSRFVLLLLVGEKSHRLPPGQWMYHNRRIVGGGGCSGVLPRCQQSVLVTPGWAAKHAVGTL